MVGTKPPGFKNGKKLKVVPLLKDGEKKFSGKFLEDELNFLFKMPVLELAHVEECTLQIPWLQQ